MTTPNLGVRNVTNMMQTQTSTARRLLVAFLAVALAAALPSLAASKPASEPGPKAFDCSTKPARHPHCQEPRLNTPFGDSRGTQPVTWWTTVPKNVGSDPATRWGNWVAFQSNHVRTAAWYSAVGPTELPLSIRCDDTGSNCHRIPIDVWVPPGHWERHRGHLEFSIRGLYSAYSPGATLVDIAAVAPDGSRVWATGFRYGGSVQIPEPASGTYVLEIIGSGNEEPVQAAVQVDSVPRPAGTVALLPNLVVLPPRDLQLAWNSTRLTYMGPAAPGIPAHGQEAMAAAGIRGCGADEAVLDGVRRCLRFSNGIGNVGAGPLMITVEDDQLALAAAGLAHWTQTIVYSDGSTTQRHAGTSEYHATHTHFHALNMSRFDLYRLEAGSGSVGELVSSTKKGGVCLGNEGWIHPDHVGSGAAPRSCGASAMRTTFLSPNWFDTYEPETNEQYIDITGLPDGDYRLVSRVDVSGLVLESDASDNYAWADVRLRADSFELLGTGSAHPMHLP